MCRFVRSRSTIVGISRQHAYGQVCSKMAVFRVAKAWSSCRATALSIRDNNTNGPVGKLLRREVGSRLAHWPFCSADVAEAWGGVKGCISAPQYRRWRTETVSTLHAQAFNSSKRRVPYAEVERQSDRLRGMVACSLGATEEASGCW
jgi:hypothetical protein